MNQVYNMVVEVTDGRFQDRTSVSIELIDMNDNDPRFSKDVYFVRDGVVEEDPAVSSSNRQFLLSVSERRRRQLGWAGSDFVTQFDFTQVSATDGDIDRVNNIEYDLSGSYSDYFQIERNSGTRLSYTLPLLHSASPTLCLSYTPSIVTCIT